MNDEDIREDVLGALTRITDKYHKPVGLIGGKTSFDIAEETSIGVGRVRKALRDMLPDEEVACFKLTWDERDDGRDGRTLIWFKVDG